MGEQRAQAKVKRDLESREVLAIAAAPNANHDKGGHERKFVQHIEEKQIERGKGAEDAAAHDEQQDVKFLFARLDFPRAQRRGKGDNRAH